MTSSTLQPVAMLERDGFLAELDGLLAEAAGWRGRLVLVRGEAGIGKSTLVQAFASGRQGRVLWGTCDPVVPPRPFAPVFDIADRLGGPLQLALADEDRHGVSTAFLSILRAEGGPRIAVFEDVHWADEATFELLRVLGRRIEQLPALLVATLREEEVGPEHPLSIALGDIPTSAIETITLPPLSAAAVEVLAAGTLVDPGALHTAAGGNPFFVTEVLAAGGGGHLPSTVRDAVLARARRLPPGALSVLRAVSVLGQRCDLDLVLAVSAVAPAEVEACVARGMLVVDGNTVDFRHDLARQAVLASLPASERADLHRRALAGMRHRAVAIDAAGAVPHAVGAGDAGAVLELAPIAAAQAASLGAHRVAVAHYANARCYATRLSVEARATLNAAYAFECYLIDDVAEAVAVQQEVIALWTSAGDASEEGHAISELAQYLWWNGQTEEARAAVARAIAILEALPAGSNLARAYGRQAQLQMVAGDNAIAIESGRRAVDLAEQLGEEAVVVHALNTIGSAESCMGFESGVSKLEESLRRARAADLEEDIARAFNNLIATSRENRQYELLDRHVIEAIAFAEDHDLNLTLRCLVGDMAEAALERGRWREAAGHADGVLERDQRSGRIQSLIVLGRLAARRGESDPWPLLEEALELLGNEVYGEGHCPVRAARAETAWLAGDVRLAAKEVEAGVAKLDEHTNPWLAGELAFWATKVGLPVVLAGPVAEPYALYLDGHPAKAAAAWATLGCPYEQAQALADSQDQADLREALQIFQSLGAAPAAARVTDRLRALGVSRIARGPRRTTQSNPLGLTDRETEVLRCLADGLRNAEIAARLVISVKTVDHHVSAVLAKLGVRSRYDAGKEAIRLGLKAG